MRNSPLNFEEWYDVNEEEVYMEAAESGADREMDYDSEKYFEEKYEKYLETFA